MSTNAKERPFRREIELDFIRGIAILLVVDFHSRYGLLGYALRPLGIPPLGWAGVDIFFVLSGFLVGGLLVKEWRVRGSIDSKKFLVRRGFKIWPQYYVYLLALLVTGHRTLHQLWGNLLNIQNYVGGVAHTWSLAVEEHAYLLILLVLAVAARWKLRMRVLFAVFACLAAAVIVAMEVSMLHGLPVFTPTHTRLAGILFGVLLAIVYHYAPNAFRAMQRWWGLWAAVIMATLVYAYLSRLAWNPALMIDFADLSGVALLMLLYRHREGKRHGRLYRAVAWVGLYSYGIYLWHVSVDWPVAWVGERLPPSVFVAWMAVAPLVLGIALGVMMTKLVEFPMLRLRERWFPRPVDSAVGTPAEAEPVGAPAAAGLGIEFGAGVD